MSKKRVHEWNKLFQEKVNDDGWFRHFSTSTTDEYTEKLEEIIIKHH